MLDALTPINWSICTLPLLKDLDRSTLTRLLAGVTTIDAPRGTVLFRRGDACSGFHVVVIGFLKLCLQKPGGDEKVVALVGRGESFGEPEMFLDQPYRVCAQSLVDTQLIHVAKETVARELERAPQFASRIIAGLSSRLNQYLDDVEGYTLRSGTERVIAYLLKLLPEKSAADTSMITFPTQKRIIASHLNLTHEHFSRILHELMVAGLIEVRGRVVRIRDARQLRRLGA